MLAQARALSEARIRITELEQQLADEKERADHHTEAAALYDKRWCEACSLLNEKDAKITEQDKLLDECEEFMSILCREDLASKLERLSRQDRLLTKLRDRKNG